MGVCQSCLGQVRRDYVMEDETTRLLFDDPNGIHYGSFSEQQMTSQNDPMEAQREIEALQRVVARTSDNMVDIFEIATPKESHQRAPATPYGMVGQEARQLRYQTLLSKLGADDHDPAFEARTHSSHDVEVEVEVEDQKWLTDDGNGLSLARWGRLQVQAEASDAVVGNFREAAAAME